jgi:hypothetical protein
MSIEKMDELIKGVNDLAENIAQTKLDLYENYVWQNSKLFRRISLSDIVECLPVQVKQCLKDNLPRQTLNDATFDMHELLLGSKMKGRVKQVYIKDVSDEIQERAIIQLKKELDEVNKAPEPNHVKNNRNFLKKTQEFFKTLWRLR